MTALRSCVCVLALGIGVGVGIADEPNTEEAANNDAAATAAGVTQQKESLTPLQELVGQWRGVGQPQRGSTRGAWIEQTEWQWQFDAEGAALVFAAPEAKYFSKGRIAPTEKDGRYQLSAESPLSDEPVVYTGTLDDGTLLLDVSEPVDGLPARVTLRTVAEGKRLVMLYESRLGDTERFMRLAEIGYTRRGSGFGQGITYPECVVTGGFSDRTVEYNGQRYPICCEGCRDLFLMDPEGVLAEYQAKRDERARERAEQERARE